MDSSVIWHTAYYSCYNINAYYVHRTQMFTKANLVILILGKQSEILSEGDVPSSEGVVSPFITGMIITGMWMDMELWILTQWLQVSFMLGGHHITIGNNVMASMRFHYVRNWIGAPVSCTSTYTCSVILEGGILDTLF